MDRLLPLELVSNSSEWRTLTSVKPQHSKKMASGREASIRVCGSCKRSPLSSGGDVSTLMNISLLTASHCQPWPFVLQTNPSEREEILGRHLPQVIIEVPVTQRPLHAAIHSAEEAVFRPRKQESAIKSCTRNNKSECG